MHVDELNPDHQCAAFYAYAGHLDSASPGTGRDWIRRTIDTIDAGGIETALADAAFCEGVRTACDPLHAPAYRELYSIQRAAVRYVAEFISDDDGADCQDLSEVSDN